MRLAHRLFRLTGLLLVLIVLLSGTGASLRAQEATETPEAPAAQPDDPSLVIPTEAPAEITPEALIESPVPPEEPSPLTPTEAAAEITPEAPIDPAPTLEQTSPEPPLSLLARELFNTEELSSWQVAGQWSFVPAGEGLSLETFGGGTLLLNRGPFYNAAAQASFQFASAAPQIRLRDSAAGNYTAEMTAAGEIRLFRAGQLVQSTVWSGALSGGWHSLRLSAIEDVLRVTVDEVEVMTFVDSAPLPPGSVIVGAQYAADARPDVLLLDDFFLWVPTAEIDLYPPPTIPPTETTPADPAPEATETAEPTETSPEILEPTPEPEIILPEVSPVPDTVKDTSFFPPPSGDQVQAAGPANDHFAGARVLNVPTLSLGNSTTATLEGNEPGSSCGFNIANTVWFSFTPGASASYTLNTLGSDFDTILTIYTGSTIDALTQAACNDDTATSTRASVTLPLTAGTTYWIQLGGYNGRYGSYLLTLQQVGVPLPTAPVLIAPANAASINDTTPTFSWNAATNASYYEVQIATNSIFTTGLTGGTGFSETTFTANPLPDTLPLGTLYYWRVRAFNVNGQPGIWSALRSFRLDTQTLPPNLSLPLDDAITNLSRPTLSWIPAAGANGYLIDIAIDEAFTTPVVTDLAVIPSAFVLNFSLAPGEYFWRVQSKDLAGNVSGESAIRSFTVNLSIAPLHNAIFYTATTSTVVFSWTSVIGATGYTLEIDDNDTFSSPDAHPVVTPSKILTGVAHGVYFWRVTPTWGTPPAVVPPNLPFRKVTISPLAPAAPILTAPLANAALNDDTPFLDWQDVTSAGGPFTYEVMVDNNAAFLTPEVSTIVTPSEFQVIDPLANGIFYWRVRAINNLGVPGAWSILRLFTIDTITLPPNLSLPLDDAITNLSRPTLSWIPAPGANSYLIDIAIDEAFTTPVVTDLAVIPSAFVLNFSLAPGEYFWRVQSKDVAGNVSGESAIRSFTVNLSIAPLHNAIFYTATTSTVVFSWTSVIGATGYTLEIDDNDTFSSPDAHPVVTPSKILTGLTHGVYFWRVTPTWGTPPAVVPPNLPFRKVTISPLAPAAPILTAPLANAALNDDTPFLDWQDVTSAGGPFTYEVMVDNVSNFLTPEVSTIVTPSEYQIPDPLANGIFYWRVRAINNLGVPGAWSILRLFTVDTITLPPNLSLPLDDAITNLSRPTLSWIPAPGANGYLIDIAIDEAFTTPVVTDLAVIPSAFVLNFSLAPGEYFWRVQSKDLAGNVSGESEIRSFTVNLSVAPLHNAIFYTATTSTVVFSWTSVIGATGYTLEIDDNDTFSSPDAHPVVTPSKILTGVAHGVYFWRVTPTWGTPPAVVPPNLPFRKVTISPLAPAAPILTAPLANAALNDDTPFLDWQDVTSAGGPFTYEVMVDNNAAFLNPEVSTIVTPSEFQVIDPLANGIFYWRVRAINNLGVPGAWSILRLFTVDTIPPGIPSLRLPANDAIVTISQPGLSWTPVIGATKYDLMIGTNDPPDQLITDLVGSVYMPPAPLLPTIYYWQVRAKDAAGNVSDWSELRMFKIVSGLGELPRLNRFTTSTPTLSWTEISWTDPNGYYQIQVDNHITFTSPEYQNLFIQALSVAVDPLSDGLWYWRVRACDQFNVCGLWSTTGSFLIEN